MAFFVVTMTHPDGPGWSAHAPAHVDYLQTLVARGILRASGPLKGLGHRAGFLVFNAASRAEVETIVAGDPFAEADLIERLVIDEWDPLFGIFAAESSGSLPGVGVVGG